MEEKKTRDEIMESMRQCVKSYDCMNCPYIGHTACKSIMIADALRIMEEQEERIYILEERIAIMGVFE